VSGAPRTTPTLPAESSERREAKQSAEPADPAEPIERIEQAEPTDPIESTEPTEPSESTEPSLAIESSDLLDQRDKRELSRDVRIPLTLGAARVYRADSNARPRPQLAAGYAHSVEEDWVVALGSLLEAPSAAVLTTYRRDGSALVSPVWFRWHEGAFEVVIAQGDVKLRQLARDPRCALVVFETVPPFRGIEVRGRPTLDAGDATSARSAIAARYLGAGDGARFVAARAQPGVLLRLLPEARRVWDLAAILPT
jgi:PPOX class probable F420-dependent enzyme